MDPLEDQYIRIRVVLPLPTRASYPDAQPAVASSSSLAAVADSPNTPLEALGEVPPPAAAAASLAADSSTSATTRANACVPAATRRSLASFLVAAPSAASLNHAESKHHEQRNRGEDLRQQRQGELQERGAEKQQERLKQQHGEQKQQHRRRRGTRVQKLVKIEKEEQQQQLTEECRPQQDADPRQQQRDGKHQQNEVRQEKKSEEHAEHFLNSPAKEEGQQAACVNYGDEQRGEEDTTVFLEADMAVHETAADLRGVLLELLPSCLLTNYCVRWKSTILVDRVPFSHVGLQQQDKLFLLPLPYDAAALFEHLQRFQIVALGCSSSSAALDGSAATSGAVTAAGEEEEKEATTNAETANLTTAAAEEEAAAAEPAAEEAVAEEAVAEEAAAEEAAAEDAAAEAVVAVGMSSVARADDEEETPKWKVAAAEPLLLMRQLPDPADPAGPYGLFLKPLVLQQLRQADVAEQQKQKQQHQEEFEPLREELHKLRQQQEEMLLALDDEAVSSGCCCADGREAAASNVGDNEAKRSGSSSTAATTQASGASLVGGKDTVAAGTPMKKQQTKKLKQKTQQQQQQQKGLQAGQQQQPLDHQQIQTKLKDAHAHRERWATQEKQTQGEKQEHVRVESEDLRRAAATEGKDAPNRRSSHSAPSGCCRNEQVSNSRRYNNSDRSTCDYTVNSGESGSNSSTTPSNKGGVCVSHDCETEMKEKSICSNSKSSVTCGSSQRSITERSRNAPTGDTKTSLAAPSRAAGTAAAAAAMSASKQVAKPKCTCCSRLETILLNSPSGSAPPPGRPCARRLEWHFFSSSSNGEIARLLLLTLENQLLHISCRAEGFHVFAITSSSSSLHTSPLPWLSASADSIILPDGETKKTITLTDTAAAAYIFTSIGDLLAAYSEQFIRSMHALAPAEVDADLPYRLMSLLRTRYHFLVSGSCSSCCCFQHTPQKEEHVCSNTSSSISSSQTTYSSGSVKGTCSLSQKCLSEEKNKDDRSCRNEIKKEAAPGDSASHTEAAAETCPQPDTYSMKVDPQQQQIDVSEKKQKDNVHCPAQEQRKERSWYSDAVRVRQMPADSLHDVLQKDKAAFKAALHAVESFRDSLARVARSGCRSSSVSLVANERRRGSWIASSSSSSSSSDTSCCVERNACKGESQILLRRGIEMHIAETIKWLPAAAGGAVQQQKQELPLVHCTAIQPQQLCSRDELRAEMRGLELLERLQVFHGGLPAAPQRASRAVDATAAIATAATATAIPAEALGTTAGAPAAVAEALKAGKKGDADAQDAAAAIKAASLRDTTETSAAEITAALSTVAQSEGQQTHRDTGAYETSRKGSHQSGEEGRVKKQERQEQHSEKQQQPDPQNEQMQVEQQRQRQSQQEIVDREARGNGQNQWSLSAPYGVLVDYEGIRVACKTPFFAAAGEAAGEAAEGDFTESLGMTSAAGGAADFANRDAAPAASTAGTAEQVSVPATIDAAAQNKTAAAVAEELIEKRLGCLLGLRRHHASDFKTPLPLADAVAWTADMQRQQIRLVRTGKLLPLDCSSRLQQREDIGSAAGSSTMSMEAVAAAASLTETEGQAQVTAPSAETMKEEQGAAAGTEVAAAGTAAAAAEQRGKQELSAAIAAADVEERQELTLLRPELMAGYIGFRRRRAVVAAVRSRQVTSSMTLSSRINSSRGNVTLPAGQDTSDGSSTPLLKINSKDAASTTEVAGTLLLDRATEETSAETPVAGEIAATEPKLSSAFASTGTSSFESTGRAKDGAIALERNPPATAAAAPRSPAGVYTKDNLDVSCCASSPLPAAAANLEGKEDTLIYSFDTELHYRLEQEMYRRLPLMLSGALACMRCWCKQDGGLGLFEARGAVLAAASSTTTVAAPAAVSSTATTTCAKDAAADAAAPSSRRAAAGSSEDNEVPVRERLLPLVERVLLHCLLMSKAEQRANFYEQKELLQGSKNLSTETQEGAERTGGQRRGELLQAEKKSTRNMPQAQALEQVQQDGRNDLGQQQHQGTQVQQQQQQQQKQGRQVIGKRRKKQQKERGQQVQQKPQQQKGNEDQLKPSDGGSRLTVEEVAPREPDVLQEAAEERDGEEAAAEGRQQQKVEEELLTFCLSGEEIELLQLFPVEVDVSLLLGLDLSIRSRQMAAELLQRALASPSLAACCCSSATPAAAVTCAEHSSLQATDVIAECSREGSTGTATGLTQPLCVIKQQQQSQQQEVHDQRELLEREGLQDQSLRVEDLQQRCPACVEDSCFWEGDRICYTVSEHLPGYAAATTSLPLSPLRTLSATGPAAAGAAAAGYEVDVSAAMAAVALSTASGEKHTSRRLNQVQYFTSSSNAGVSESNTSSSNSDNDMLVSSSCTETRRSAASLAGSCMKGAAAVSAEAQEAAVYIHRVAIPLLRELLLQHVANNLVLESSSLKRFFHYCGVNLRYIGAVATSLHNEVAAADHGKLHVSSSSSSSASSSCSSFGPAADAAADPVQCLAAAPGAENTATKTVKQCTAARSSSSLPGKTRQHARGNHEDVVLRVLQVELAIRCAVHCFNAILAQVNQTQIAAAAVHLLSCLLCPGTAEYPSKTFPVPSCLSRFFPSTSSSRSCRSNPPQARQRKSQQQQEQQQHQQHQQRQQPKIECGAGGISLASQVERREDEARPSLQEDDRYVVEFSWWNTTARGLWKYIKLRMRTHFNYQVFSSRSSDIRADWAWFAESTHRYRLLRGVCSAVGIQLNASHDFAAFLTTSSPPFLRILEPWLNLSPPTVAPIPAVAVSRAVAADSAVAAVAAAASPSARASAADDLHGDHRASCRGPDTPQKEKIFSTAAVALPGPASSIQPSDASTEATGYDAATISSRERFTQAAGDHSVSVSDVSVTQHRSVSPRICMSSSEGGSQRRHSHDSTHNGSTESSSSRGIEVSSSCLKRKGDTCEVNTRVISQRQGYGSSLEDKEEGLAAETATTASAIGHAAAGENAARTRGNETQQERGLLLRQQQQQHERNVNQSIDSNSSESQSTTAEHTAARAVRSRRRSLAHPQQQQDKLQQNRRDYGGPLQLQQQCERHTETPNSSWRPLKLDSFCRCFPVVKTDAVVSPLVSGLLATATEACAIGWLDVALEIYQQTLYIIHQITGTVCREAALCYTAMGHVMLALDEYLTACNYFQKALILTERCEGVDHPTTIELHAALSRALAELPGEAYLLRSMQHVLRALLLLRLWGGTATAAQEVVVLLLLAAKRMQQRRQLYGTTSSSSNKSSSNSGGAHETGARTMSSSSEQDRKTTPNKSDSSSSSISERPRSSDGSRKKKRKNRGLLHEQQKIADEISSSCSLPRQQQDKRHSHMMVPEGLQQRNLYRGNASEQQQQLQEANKRRSSAADVQFFLSKATEILDTIPEHNPASLAELHIDISQCYYVEENFRKALHHCRRAHQLQGSNRQSATPAEELRMKKVEEHLMFLTHQAVMAEKKQRNAATERKDLVRRLRAVMKYKRNGKVLMW